MGINVNRFGDSNEGVRQFVVTLQDEAKEDFDRVVERFPDDDEGVFAHIFYNGLWIMSQIEVIPHKIKCQNISKDGQR